MRRSMKTFVFPNRKYVALVLFTGGMVFASVGISAEGTQWEINPRIVPIPMGASQQLQESLAATHVPDVEARKKMADTDIDWMAIIEQRANATPLDLPTLSKQLDLTIKSDEIEGVKVYHVMPNDPDPAFKDRLFLNVHGGSYVFGGGVASVGEAAVIANRAKIAVLSVDYRMPPNHPFPAAVEDTVIVYKHLLKSLPGKAIAIGGTSAGGGLALAAVHRFIALKLDVPGAIYAGTPWADLTKTGDSLFTNEGIDRVLVTYDGTLGAAARLYANGHDLQDPLISPVYGKFKGFPPTYLVTGTRDMFLSDTVRTHRKLRNAGVIADLNVYEGMSHGGYLVLPNSPESMQVYSELRDFLKQHLKDRKY